jgi:hypothetical protein
MVVFFLGVYVKPHRTERRKFKRSNTMPESIYLAWYRCFLPCYTQKIP